ncbi:MAG: ankyrin repeat domain-containing protein [Halobacteriovoraceae bacterium]|nr:ankyrin repeat domain-containing protein [Halobacteriovoraceae bacterium]MCB9094010.1 ankyrin repeat domain-containing protein [Halobacteriovoraceae bacterium]
MKIILILFLFFLGCGQEKKTTVIAPLKLSQNPDEVQMKMISAATSQNYFYIQEVLNRSDETNQPREKLANTQNQYGENILTILLENSSNCQSDCLETIKNLIRSGAQINQRSRNGFTPLYIAVSNNSEEIVRILLENHANAQLTYGGDQHTVFDIAKINGNQSILDSLNSLENFHQ